MLYAVKGRYIEENLAEFYGRLTNGSIRAQKPDGAEICDAMERARITRPGIVEWTETCYCDPPLAHEKRTVYDHFFTELMAEEIDEEEPINGESFMETLKQAQV